MPETRNGPKGTSDLIFFFLAKINPTPIIAPKEKAKNKATKMAGNPRNNPIKKASLTSPKPIALPLEIKKISKKKAEAEIADKNGLIKVLKSKFQNPNSK